MRFAVLAVAVMVSGAAVAEDRPFLDPLRKACAEDTKKFCADVEPGGGRVVRCLRDNEDKLSQPCKDARADARSRIERKSGSPKE